MDENQSSPNDSPTPVTPPGGRVLMWLVLICYGVSIFLIAVVFYYIWSSLKLDGLPSQTFAVRLMQTTLGMLIGVTFAITGVYAVSIGLIEATNVEVTGWGKAAATGPGGLLVISGTIIIAICLTRSFEITERGGVGTDLKPAQVDTQPM